MLVGCSGIHSADLRIGLEDFRKPNYGRFVIRSQTRDLSLLRIRSMMELVGVATYGELCWQLDSVMHSMNCGRLRRLGDDLFDAGK